MPHQGQAFGQRAGVFFKRGAVLRRLRLSDLLFHNLTRLAAVLVLALLSGVIVALVIGAAPALGRRARGPRAGRRAGGAGARP